MATLCPIEHTEGNEKLKLTLALSYSGRWEIIEGVKKLVEDIEEGKVQKENINEDMFSNYLTTKEIPDPELMIRTSGEMRISNFLLWQLAYTEIVITDVLWPDFRKNDLFECIRSFQARERRFGKTSEQLRA